jgi:hypothetical protein
MKKYIIVPVVIFLLQTTSSFATVDLSIGGTAWYAWWKPAWSDANSTSFVYSGRPSIFLERSHDFKPTSNAMAGPVLSIGFLNRWSIQSVFAIGRFKSYSQGLSTNTIVSLPTSGALSYKKYSRDILKWDSDTSISCAVHRMVKIFVGFKSQGYRYEEHMDDYMYQTSLMFIRRVLTDDVKAYGGGLGLGLTFPLGADFYLMMSASGLVLWSFEKIDINWTKSFVVANPITPLPVLPQKGRYFSYGGSAALSLAYNISKINTTISLGGRYQLLFNRQRYNNLLNNDVAMNIIDKKYDHFFGITMSAIYTFHIGKKD